MVHENIGENLRSIRREKKGRSAAKVVERMNRYGYEMSVDTYYKWERGTRKLPCEAVPYVARALETSEGRIFHLHGEGEGSGSLSALLEMYGAMPEEDRALLFELAGRLSRGEMC